MSDNNNKEGGGEEKLLVGLGYVRRVLGLLRA